MEKWDILLETLEKGDRERGYLTGDTGEKGYLTGDTGERGHLTEDTGEKRDI